MVNYGIWRLLYKLHKFKADFLYTFTIAKFRASQPSTRGRLYHLGVYLSIGKIYKLFALLLYNLHKKKEVGQRPTLIFIYLTT